MREKILSLQMKDAKDAQRYLGEHDALRRDLIQMGVAYSDSEAVFNLLKGLPHTGTWLAFKLMLQTSVSMSTSSASTSGVLFISASTPASSASRSSASTSGAGTSASGTGASASAAVAAPTSGSSVSWLLSVARGTTFESVSVRIAAEAHRQVLESTLVSPPGTEYAHAVGVPPSGRSMNQATGLRRTKNNPSGTYCDTPLEDGTTCGAANHDRAHCFKLGGGMAGQQPAHWRQPQGKGKQGPALNVTPSTTTSLPATVPGTSPASSTPLAASAVTTPSGTWATRDYDLSCASIVEVVDAMPVGGVMLDDCPSRDVLACLSTPGHTCLLDSGTSRNLLRDRAHFRSYSVDDSVRVRTANHGYLLTSGSGECVGLLNIGGHKHKVKFSGCLHAPGAMLNLLSVGWMLTKGWDCHFRGNPSRCDLSYRATALGSVSLQNNLCFLDLEFIHFDAPLPILQTPTPLAAFARVAVTHDLWHARLGHVGGEAARHAARFADGVGVTSSAPLSVCESCIVGKHPRQPFHSSESPRSTGFLDLVHADVAGPMPVQTPHGRCYFLVILDDFTHILDLHLLTSKDQALDAWESTRRRWETKFSRRVKVFQSDNGGEFVNSAFISALNTAGISHQLSVPYMHQQNGVAERVIRTIEGHLLAMLHQAGLPQMYWGEAALAAAYLHNRTESRALPPGRTPYEMLHGQRPNLSHLRVWGSRAFAHIPLELQAKLGPKSREVLFMGYPPGVKGY